MRDATLRMMANVSALARRLQIIAREIEIDWLPHDQVATDEQLAEYVRLYLKARRRRDHIFPAELFADPAWDIILDLFAQEHLGRAVSISSCCVAANVPATTALRWISMLESVGMVVRVADTGDKRRSFIRLSPCARQMTRQWAMEAMRLKI